jgi:hypothetical protein
MLSWRSRGKAAKAMRGSDEGDDEKSVRADLITVCRSTQLTPAAYRFYRAILLFFAERGGAPDQAPLRELAARFGVPLAATLTELATKGLVQRDPATGAMLVAYPFSSGPTAHRVTLVPATVEGTTDRDPRHIFAMCALDALGIPLLLRRDARIASQDALTGETIEVHVQVQGTDAAALTEAMGWEAEWSPASTVIYARAPEHEHEQECNVDAASACCPVINFFTTQAHARAWAEAHPVAGGVLLTQVDAFMYAMRMHGV